MYVYSLYCDDKRHLHVHSPSVIVWVRSLVDRA